MMFSMEIYYAFKRQNAHAPHITGSTKHFGLFMVITWEVNVTNVKSPIKASPSFDEFYPVKTEMGVAHKHSKIHKTIQIFAHILPSYS